MVYWTELDGLPSDIKDELKQGEIPWTLRKNDEQQGTKPLF
jgi:hypothetical protein